MKYAILVAAVALLAAPAVAQAAPNGTNAATRSNESCSDGLRPQAAPLDANAVAAAKHITVMQVTDCSGLLQLDSSDVAELQSTPRIAAALQRTGGQDIVSYDLNNSGDITIFVKKNS